MTLSGYVPIPKNVVLTQQSTFIKIILRITNESDFCSASGSVVHGPCRLRHWTKSHSREYPTYAHKGDSVCPSCLLSDTDKEERIERDENIIRRTS